VVLAETLPWSDVQRPFTVATTLPWALAFSYTSCKKLHCMLWNFRYNPSLVALLSVHILRIFLSLGVCTAASWCSHASNSRSMHGRHDRSSLGDGRVPTAIRRLRQTSTSGRTSDDVTASQSASIGRDAVTCYRHVFRDWLRVERVRQLFSSVLNRCVHTTSIARDIVTLGCWHLLHGHCQSTCRPNIIEWQNETASWVVVVGL